MLHLYVMYMYIYLHLFNWKNEFALGKISTIKLNDNNKIFLVDE